MEAIIIDGVRVPVPEGWELADNCKSYIGDAGLVDPSQTEDETPVDERRASIAEDHLAAYSPEGPTKT